jgi:serine/threonine-protein kinase
VLAGKYRVERVVGVGGMGVVVAATHLQLEERVALKLLKREVMRQETVARFLREARAAAKIKSEHVARVTDVGTLESGVPYMVMELLDGEDLGSLVREHGPLPVAQAVDYVLQAGEAVAEAHALGIVHRDLKPANLVLARRAGGQRVVKVVDFGISKQMSREGEAPHADAAMTRTSAWLGSPLYMSPEQMRSAKDVDARTDLWSLGLILFELCTGHLPFDAPSLVELYGAVMHGEPVPLATWCPDAPPALGMALGRCLQKDRTQRYAAVAEMARDLAPIAPPSARERIARIISLGESPSATRHASTPPSEPESALPLLLVRASSKVAVSSPTGARSSTPPAEAVAEPHEGRRSGAPWLLLLLLLALLAAGGGGAYSRYSTRGWPFRALRAPVTMGGDPPNPPAAREAPAEGPAPDRSAPAVAAVGIAPAPNAGAIAGPQAAPAPAASTVDAGSDAGGHPMEAARDAGGSRAAVRKGAGNGHGPAPASPSEGAPQTPGGEAAPVPAGALRPEVIVETCTQPMPDGTRKQIPCP